MSVDGELPHLLVYGPHGSGKRTHILALLREIYGEAEMCTVLESRAFRLKAQKTIDLSVLYNDHSLEMSPIGIEDQHCAAVLGQIIGAMAASRPQQGLKHYTDASPVNKTHPQKFKVLFIKNADSLSHQAQAALRRTMEVNTSFCRLILSCTSTNKILEPIRSRCLNVRIPAPTAESICQLLTSVADKEGHSITHAAAQAVVKENGRNLRRCLTGLQSFLTSPTKTMTAPWQNYVQALVDEISKDSSPATLLRCRGRVAELNSCVQFTVMLKYLLRVVLDRAEHDSDKCTIVAWAAECDARCCIGGEACIHIEAFIAKVMTLKLV
jgi:replication factor C subunit 3/5